MYEKIGKRSLDFTTTLILIVSFALPMLVIIVWIKLDSRGPVLFKQLRYGKNLKPFTIYKFRTMSIDAPHDAPTSEFKNAAMFITRSGRIIRKLSLDELPQLFNVLIGNMSIIGPRPVVLKEVKLIDLRSAVGANNVKPGITGWAQVNGRDELSDFTKAYLDGVYVSKYGFNMDFICLLMTFWTVASAKGQKEGHEQKGILNESLFNSLLAVDER